MHSLIYPCNKDESSSEAIDLLLALASWRLQEVLSKSCSAGNHKLSLPTHQRETASNQEAQFVGETLALHCDFLLNRLPHDKFLGRLLPIALLFISSA